MFEPNALYYVDAYKVSHKKMLAEDTQRLYGTSIPRSLKYGPKGATKIVSFGQRMAWRWIHDVFQKQFFALSREEAMIFGKDMSMMLMQEYDAEHFGELHDLGYLPIKACALDEGIETLPNIPHADFINTVDGFAWLTLYLETIFSALSWKPSLAATIAKQYRRNTIEWVKKTDPDNLWLVDYMCHDFSARGLNPHDMVSVGLGHATSFRGSDTLVAIPAARYYYGEPSIEVIINSVNASEHSVSTTKIFTVGEKQMISDWLKAFPKGILSIVADTFDLWKLITEYVFQLKDEILARDGKLVIRPDSGDPVDIICGVNTNPRVSDEVMPYEQCSDTFRKTFSESEHKGVIELLWDIFGGTINNQGYKVLDPHIGAIYGDSITLDRQIEIYTRLAAKGFASTNIVLGVGSFTYAYNTRDSIGMAIKGAWFETSTDEYNIYKDPVTDDGTKKSLKGFQYVYKDSEGEYRVQSEVDEYKHDDFRNELKPIYENGGFFNQTTLTEVRNRLKEEEKFQLV